MEKFEKDGLRKIDGKREDPLFPKKVRLKFPNNWKRLFLLYQSKNSGPSVFFEIGARLPTGTFFYDSNNMLLFN